jgi:hypothetical protein
LGVFGEKTFELSSGVKAGEDTNMSSLIPTEAQAPEEVNLSTEPQQQPQSEITIILPLGIVEKSLHQQHRPLVEEAPMSLTT